MQTLTRTMFFVLALLIYSAGQLNAQCLSIPIPFEERVEQSELIVEGKVISQRCFWGVTYSLIFTANEIEVYKIFKGNLEAETVEVVTYGGVIGDQALAVHPSLKLQPDNTGIFLIQQNKGSRIASGLTPVWKSTEVQGGFIKYNERTGQPYDPYGQSFSSKEDLYQQLENLVGKPSKKLKTPTAPPSSVNFLPPSITSFSPDSVRGGTSETLTINGSGFGSTAGTIFFPNADNSGNTYVGTPSSQIISWNDNTIVTEVPDGGGTGAFFVQDNGGAQSNLSPTDLIVPYSIINVNTSPPEEAKLIDDMADGDGGYGFNYIDNTANNGVDITAIPDAVAALERAVNTWNTGTGLPYYVGTQCGTTSIQIPDDDGINIMGFDSDAYDLGVERGMSVIGVAFSYFLKCGPTGWEILDMDVLFRRDGEVLTPGGFILNWEYGPGSPSLQEIDFETVALHEIGHNEQLGHIINSNGLMHASVFVGSTNRTLGQADDIAGGNYVISNNCTGYNPPIVNCTGVPELLLSRQCVPYNSNTNCFNLMILPVELALFDATLQNEQVDLYWATQTERSNAYFTIERSADAQNFTEIARLPGAGTSEEPQEYFTVDPNPQIGTNYYRLVQYDLDGHFEYLGTRAVEYNWESSFTIVGNPVRDQLNLKIQLPQQQQQLIMEIYSASGTNVLRETLQTSGGYFDHQLPVKHLQRGVYFLKIGNKQMFRTLRFVK